MFVLACTEENAIRSTLEIPGKSASCGSSRCRAAELQSCRAAELQSCRAAEMKGWCRDAGADDVQMCRGAEGPSEVHRCIGA